MMLGTLLLAAGLGFAALAVLVLLGDRVRVGMAGYARWLWGLAAGSYLLALGVLSAQFLVTDYSNGYVWNHTADFLHPIYRLSGVFAGIEGSLLLWATFVALAVLWVGVRHADREGSWGVGVVAGLLLVAIGSISLLRTPFQPLSIAGGQYVFGPRGLNPLLQNPYMAIHPPLTFLGYALTTVPFAIGLAHFGRRVRGQHGLFEPWLGAITQWLRLAWIALTAAVALGALWSYVTLGWGGLWAWDPVETGILVAWLLVTAALHAVGNARSRDRNQILAAALTTLTVPAVVFARYVTIGGFSDLHSFGFGSTTPTLLLLAVTTALGIGLPLWVWLTEPAEEAETFEAVDVVRLLSVLVLLGLLVVYVWGIVFPRLFATVSTGEISVTTDFFNTWTYPFALLTLFAIGWLNDASRAGGPSKSLLVGAVVLTGVVAALPMESWQFGVTETTGYYRVLGSINALSLFPAAAYAAGPSLYGLATDVREGDGDRRFARLGTTLAHLGIALLIVTAPFTYMGASSGTYVVPTETDGGLDIADGDLELSVQETSVERRAGTINLSPDERVQVLDQFRTLGGPPQSLSAGATGTAIVWGEVTAVESAGQLARYQLNDSSVWIETPAREPVPEAGLVYVQGQINRSVPDRTLIRSDGQFLGSDPLDAITPAQRVTSSHVDLTVSDGDRTLVAGRTSVHSHFQYGIVTDVLLARGLVADTYVIPNQVTTFEGMEVAVLSVKQIPGMGGVRLAILLLVLGGLVQLRYGRKGNRAVQ